MTIKPAQVLSHLREESRLYPNRYSGEELDIIISLIDAGRVTLGTLKHEEQVCSYVGEAGEWVERELYLDILEVAA